jgi:hypothetical protein
MVCRWKSISYSVSSVESHDLVDLSHTCERKTQYACDRARFAGSRPVVTIILARIEETGVLAQKTGCQVLGLAAESLSIGLLVSLKVKVKLATLEFVTPSVICFSDLGMKYSSFSILRDRVCKSQPSAFLKLSIAT